MNPGVPWNPIWETLVWCVKITSFSVNAYSKCVLLSFLNNFSKFVFLSVESVITKNSFFKLPPRCKLFENLSYIFLNGPFYRQKIISVLTKTASSYEVKYFNVTKVFHYWILKQFKFVTFCETFKKWCFHMDS